MKRILDILISIFTLLIFGPLILSLIVIQTMDTKQFGLFRQIRVGKKGKLFYVYKIRTMIKDKSITTNITTAKDKRITKNGKFLRKYKFDELPQFFNVFIGNMSIVGPRPDVQDFINEINYDERSILLSIKPGITGPGSLELIDEEEILANVVDPHKYNLEIIWPKKLKLIKEYIKNYSIIYDLKIIFKTMKLILKKIN